MNTQALDLCLRLDQAHARLRRKLDDELGRFHGLGLADFVLLRALGDAQDAGLTAAELERPVGVQRSAVIRQVIALEKTGLVQRTAAAAGQRRVQLRGPGRRLLQEAAETAAAICGAALAGEVWSGAADAACIRALCESPALELR
jgi:DNA-binding MarR family transcriptional regulator